MQGYPSAWGPGQRAYTGVAPDTLGKVLGLLGVSAIFTAGGALVGTQLGVGGFWLGLIGGFACIIALNFVKDRAPINLILLYGFATFEGILVGQLLNAYVAAGLGVIVLDAAAATAAITLIAGGYGYTTKRDLTGLGSVLFLGLLAVIVASIIGFFLRIPLLYTGISAVTAVLFTGFLVYDLNRISRAGDVSEGDAILLAVSVYLDILNLFLALLRILTTLFGNQR